MIVRHCIVMDVINLVYLCYLIISCVQLCAVCAPSTAGCYTDVFYILVLLCHASLISL